MKIPSNQKLFLSLATLIVISFLSCGKNVKDTLDTMNPGGHIDTPPPANGGEMKTVSVDSITSGHATFKGELVKTPVYSNAISMGIVWDTKSHANGAEYPNHYDLPGNRSIGTFRIKRTGFAGGTTYYVRVVARSASFTPIYGNELSFTTKPSSMEYGEFIQGGILFYVDGTRKHGLVANLRDITIAGSGPKWGGDYTEPNFTTNTSIGSGKANTEQIVKYYGSSPLFPYAALGCANSEQNGYKDWFLPSIDELSQLKKNLYDTNQGWERRHFWSSSTPSAGNVWCLSTATSTDEPDLFFISSYAAVCAVRSF